ncbi:MAG TPA: outer membrane protein transport protein [Bdellovibrionales bacterium]|nr:outer membrane protein transport protein [Bdellovibrionales bacterium]
MAHQKYFLLAALISLSSTAFGAGYEKSLPFGGKAVGLAGIATPWTPGADSLFFNPAGLVTNAGHSTVLDVSYVSGTVKGPISDSNETMEDTPSALLGGAFYSWAPTEKWGFGIGYYAAGGQRAKYEDVTMSTTTNYRGTATVEADVALTELSLGGAYRVSDMFRVGFAWRASFAEASFALAQRGDHASGAVQTLSNIEVNDLKDTQYTGFRLGAQLDLSEKTQIGLTYRSEVNFKADGKYGGKVNLSAPSPISEFSIAETDASAETTFPMAINLGMKQGLTEAWNMYAEYTWTNYSKVDEIKLTGDITVNSLPTATTITPQPVKYDWKDQHNIRLAGEYLGFMMPIRFGYLWTSQVTSKDYARATSVHPGSSHGLTLGTGYTFGAFTVDGAAEYLQGKADGNGAAAGVGGPGNDIRAGEYSVSQYGLHLGLAYAF